MRLSELVGRDVVTTDGEALGKVREALLVQDGRLLAESAAAFRLHGLAVGRRAIGTQLGYSQGTVQGPGLLRRLFDRPPTMVPWAAIVNLDDERIVVDAARFAEGAALWDPAVTPPR
jgi:hypothetical protein